MKPPRFLYLRPDSVQEALAALSEHGDEAKVLAGGQSLVPLLNFRLAQPSVLIDLTLLENMRHIRSEDATLVLGAMVRQRDAERSTEVARQCSILPEALSFVGHVQIRNRGTIGGSIAHSDPAAELPAVALVTDATIVATGPRGERTLPASAFFEGPFMTALAPDEILTEVRIPAIPGSRVTFIELARRSGDFALAGVAAVNRSGSSEPPDVALAAMGVGGCAVRLGEAEEVVRGHELTDRLAEQAGDAAASAVSPMTDVHADASYRRDLLRTLVGRALRRVA